MRALTARQNEVLGVLRAGEARGRMPTVRELAKALGVRSTCTVVRYIEALEKKGFVRRSEWGSWRGVTLTAGLQERKVALLAAVWACRRDGTELPAVVAEALDGLLRAGWEPEP